MLVTAKEVVLLQQVWRYKRSIHGEIHFFREALLTIESGNSSVRISSDVISAPRHFPSLYR